jgi:hypothetical protein
MMTAQIPSATPLREVSAISLAPRRIASSVAALFGLVWLVGAVQGQTVVVQMVEAFDNPPTNTQYAPVNFNGSATATAASYPGITFHAQANLNSTLSNHAVNVANNLFGPGTVAQPFVIDVFNQTAGNFVNGLNAQGVLGPGQPLPSGIGNGIRVSNHSYVADFGNSIADENAIRRIDFVVNNENVVFAAGAVTGGSFPNQNLVWSARNSLAVRGDSVFTPFDPLTQTITSGKRRADVWSDNESSFATGRVAGFSTALIGQATNLGFPSATNNQVVRSLIMTGADKAAVPTMIPPWTRDLPNNLSVGLGAGKANYNQSLSILQAGERALQPVTGGLTPNVVTSNPQGFAFGTSVIGGQQAIVINAPNGITELTATLNWNVTQVAGATIDTSDAGRIFPNLALELRTATLSGGQFMLGAAALPNTGLSSNAALDNAEHLFFNGSGGNLPAGTYAFVIIGDPSRSAVMGFSYSFLPVPEPIGALALLPVAALLLRRRRVKTLDSVSI